MTITLVASKVDKWIVVAMVNSNSKYRRKIVRRRGNMKTNVL